MKNKIFVLALAIISFLSVDCFAQPGGGRGPGGGGRGPGGPGGAGIDLVASSGLFSFDMGKVIADAKIKDEETVNTLFGIYAQYQKAMDNLGMKYAADIKTMRAAEQQVKALQQKGDFFRIRETMQGASESIQTVKAAAILEHNKLNEAIAGVLAEKDLKRWKSFYQKLCREKSFRPTLERGQRGGGQRGEGGQGGQGGPRGERPQR